MDLKKLKINKEKGLDIVLFLIRINLGWHFMHAFIDKAFGISKGWETAWFNGASPTTGYLSGATGAFKWMAGSGFVDFLFMLGIFCIGFGLIFGVAKKLTTYSGITMMVLMWFAKPPVPGADVTFWSDALGFLWADHHVTDSIVFLLLYFTNAYERIGLGKWWKNQKLVKKHSCWLE